MIVSISWGAAGDSPEVRDQVEAEDLSEAALVDPSADYGRPDEDTGVRDHDLVVVVLPEHGRVGVEVCAMISIPKSLTGNS